VNQDFIMFCPKCGQSIPDQSKFCFACGGSVEEAAQFLRSASPTKSASEGPAVNQPIAPARTHESIGARPQAQRGPKVNIRLFAVAAVVLVIGGGMAYDILASKARARAEVEERRAAEERRKAEAQRRKDEQERLWNEAERRIQAMLAYTDSLIQSTKGRISHRETKPTDPIWVPRFLGDVDPRPATVTIGTVRFLRAPYPSMLEVKQNLGEDCECKDWKYKGEVSEEWCTWSVERPNGRKVSVTFHVYPKWDSGRDHRVQKVAIMKERLSPMSGDHADRTDYGYDEEEIQRSPSLWQSSTHH
jgi:hypothetical protein